MTQQQTKYQSYLLGMMGECLARNYFPYTLRGDRSHDFKIPTFETNYRVEVKTVRPSINRGSVGYRVIYTKPESRADYLFILCMNEDLTLKKIYFVPNKAIPKRHRAIWIGKFSSKKWKKFRIV